MATSDFLDEKRREIAERLAELKPLVDEYARLQAARTPLRVFPRPRRRYTQVRRDAGPRGL